tara:strand:+ start:198 stop:488 length:291 start_codon:yes stop_codon:yes gene_type:complete
LDNADFINTDITKFKTKIMRETKRELNSSDFYLDPMTMSYFFLEAIEQGGYGTPKGWRDKLLTGGVEVLTEDEKILRIYVGPKDEIQIEDVTNGIK